MSDLLAALGVLVAAGASAASILLPASRARAAAMLVAIALFPLLILGDQWHSQQIVDLREHPGRIIAAVAIGAAAVAALALLFRRRPILLPLAIVFALPFRVPLEAGGDTANLLVPLYVVIAAGVLAAAARDRGREARPPAALGALPKLLAGFVLLYALQALYAEDFSRALQNVCFFLVPFTLAYALLAEVEWDRRLLRWALLLLAVEALAFVVLGSVELTSRSLLWNHQVIRSNDFHTYFRVNSVFWDPNIYGRYLALVIVVATAALLWVRERRELALLTALVAVLWLGLAQTFSESSYIALLAGLAVLAALRWNWRWTVAVAVVGAIGVGAIVAASGKLRPNVVLSGRANLVSGGLELWTDRPLWGYGSGSFEAAYRDHRENKDLPVTVSHTEPVTVLAEQGLLGFGLYLGLVLVALWTMGSGLWSRPPGRGPPPAARVAVLAAFVALLVHTMSYAGFFEDPITWVLLAAAASLAAAPAVRDPA